MFELERNAIKRVREVVNSCTTIEQVDISKKYANLMGAAIFKTPYFRYLIGYEFFTKTIDSIIESKKLALKEEAKA